MNRLVIIGNGFDLAHGLKTSYADFINWYWEQWGNRLRCHAKITESDELCSFTLKGCAQWYLAWTGYYYQSENPGSPWAAHDIARKAKEDRSLCDFNYLSPFFEQINKSIETKGWVDIENEYYSMLVHENEFEGHCKALNSQLDFLRGKLVEYLIIESGKEIKLFEDIAKKILCPILRNEVSVNDRSITYREFDVPTPLGGFMFKHKQKKWDPSNIMILNFNYTNTPQHYIDNLPYVSINYIHGHIEKPQSVIFGYGDELDENYNRLKEQNDNECLRHVKSINYLQSDNYRKMLEFIESEPFQVCIMGHSCGKSDRTLLNTIFEHRNCVSIKPYYYQKPDGTDNYIELVQNISRNFTDMKLMRDRVVNKTYTEPLTKT